MYAEHSFFSVCAGHMSAFSGPGYSRIGKGTKLNEFAVGAKLRHEYDFGSTTESLITLLCPPCHEVENIDTGAVGRRIQVLRVSKALIDRADYCVCDLTGDPMGEELRKYMEKRDKPVILDIGKDNVP